jgi:hypothetical protein
MSTVDTELALVALGAMLILLAAVLLRNGIAGLTG